MLNSEKIIVNMESSVLSEPAPVGSKHTDALLKKIKIKIKSG